MIHIIDYSCDLISPLEQLQVPIYTCRWEEKLQTSHLPEMVFGESTLALTHVSSGIKVHFNAFDAICGWKQESLPPVEVPAAAEWKFRWYAYQITIIWFNF